MSNLHAARSPLPPDLPSIKEEYRPYVFTHRSYHFHKNATINPDDRLLDYDRLEFLGEGVLQGALSLYLYDTYKWHRSGHLKTVKSQLSTRDKLAGFSDAYGLVDQIRVDPGSERNIRNSQDVRAHVFKAYIGAILLTHDFETVAGWVAQLMHWSSSSPSAGSTPVAPSPISLPNVISTYSSSPYAAPGGPLLGARDRIPERKLPGPTSPSSPNSSLFRPTHRTTPSNSSSRAASTVSTLFTGPSRTSTLPTPPMPSIPSSYSDLNSFGEDPGYSHRHVDQLLRSIDWGSGLSGLSEFDEPPDRSRLERRDRQIRQEPVYRHPHHNDLDPQPLDPLWRGIDSLSISGTNSPPRSRATAFGNSALSRYGIPSVHSSSAATTPAPSTLGIPSADDLEDVTTFGTVEKFNERCHQRFIKPEWVFSNVGDALFNKWQAVVKVKGEEKGRGVGRSKQIAKELAARKAMKEMRW